MTKMSLQPASLRRRQLLGLLGSTGAAGAVGLTGTAAGAPEGELSVELFAFVDDRCLAEDCPDADYVLPVGTTVDFGAYVTGAYDKAASFRRDRESGATTLLETCPSDSPVEPCKEFTVTFDEPGTVEVQYVAGSPESEPVVPVEFLGADDQEDPALPDCDGSDAIACDSVTIAVVDPTPQVSVSRLGEPAPIRPGDTLVVEAQLDPRLRVDRWDIQTEGVPTEDAALPDIDLPEGVVRWGKRPLGSGTLELTVTATLGGVTETLGTEVTVNSRSGLSVRASALAVDEPALAGQVQLANDTQTERTATVSLFARDSEAEAELTIEQQALSVPAGEETIVELSGTAPAEADTAVLRLDDEVLDQRSFDDAE